MEEEQEWPPPEARLTSIVWRAEGHLERREYVAAARTAAEGFQLRDAELLRGLHHLAAAGYKQEAGDVTRAQRQLAHARRRLEPYLPEFRGVDLVALLQSVERVVESPGGGGELA